MVKYISVAPGFQVRLGLHDHVKIVTIIQLKSFYTVVSLILMSKVTGSYRPEAMQLASRRRLWP
jgi:hypothetical protein